MPVQYVCYVSQTILQGAEEKFQKCKECQKCKEFQPAKENKACLERDLLLETETAGDCWYGGWYVYTTHAEEER